MNTQNNTLGGGEILGYLGQDKNGSGYKFMDSSLIAQFELMWIVKVAIILLIVVLMIVAIIKILKVKMPFKGRAIVNELEHLEEVRKRDESIKRANKFIGDLVTFIEHTPFKLDKLRYEYLEYNLIRADIKAPGGHRVLKPIEYNAIIKTMQILGFIVGILSTVLISPLLGMVIVICVSVIGGTLPLMIIRAKVKKKDDEIIENFSDFYLMIHYVLMARANTPLSGIMKSYDKTTNSQEMHKFVNTCIFHLDTYGDYEGPVKIAERYKEIPVVGKLMRLIRQANEGADIAPELKGFRQELIEAKHYTLRRKGDKIVGKAKMLFYALMPILWQAIISAMFIYINDLNLTSSIMK